MEILKYNDYTQVIKIPFTEIKKIDMALCKQPKQTLKDFYDDCKEKPTILINGGFFGLSDGGTCFNYVDEENVVHSTDLYKWGIGIVDEKILKYDSIDNRTDWRDFISGYPVLIDGGKAIDITFAKELNYNARRSVLAFDKTYLYLVAIDKPGMNYKAMQKMLLSYDVEYAINLDGGGSTRVLYNGNCITNGTENRAVDNVIAVYMKEEEEKTLYRVQVGAYSKKDNAQVMLDKIHALGGIYEKAYIRQVSGLYKCQVGAFSVKSNATKIQKELKDKGFSSFITTK